MPLAVCSQTVVRKKVLDANPSVGEALSKLCGKIDPTTIRRLNYGVEAERKSIEEVARGFLSTLA